MWCYLQSETMDDRSEYASNVDKIENLAVIDFANQSLVTKQVAYRR